MNISLCETLRIAFIGSFYCNSSTSMRMAMRIDNTGTTTVSSWKCVGGSSKPVIDYCTVKHARRTRTTTLQPCNSTIGAKPGCACRQAFHVRSYLVQCDNTHLSYECTNNDKGSSQQHAPHPVNSFGPCITSYPSPFIIILPCPREQ